MRKGKSSGTLKHLQEEFVPEKMQWRARRHICFSGHRNYLVILIVKLEINYNQLKTNFCVFGSISSLITNSFTLNSGGAPARSASGRRINEQRVRNMQRHRLSFLNNENATVLGLEDGEEEEVQGDENVEKTPKSSKRMLVDDVSFYETSPQVADSPRPCSVSPFHDHDEEEGSLFSAAETSPVNFKIIETKSAPESSEPKLRSFDEVHDSNSMDSGYGASFGQFRFAQPTRMAPRRLDSGIAASPKSVPSTSSSSSTVPKARTSFSVFSCSSQGSMESMMDEDYMDLFEMDTMDCNTGNEMPSNISSLICGAIKTTSSSAKSTPDRTKSSGKPKVRRCLNLDDSPAVLTPLPPSNILSISSSAVEEELSGILTPIKVNMSLDNQMNTNPIPTKSFKRPEPLSFDPVQNKRYKSEIFESGGCKTANPRLERFDFQENKENSTTTSSCMPSPVGKIPLLQRAVSMNDDMIMSALSRSSAEPDLIGDFSKPFSLPLMDGKHKDLKSISVHTMAKLVAGNFDASVATFKIIDCRYPYEFEGGHIRGAKNLYSQEQILNELVSELPQATITEEPKRNILIFHCEFSSERGPKL